VNLKLQFDAKLPQIKLHININCSQKLHTMLGRSNEIKSVVVCTKINKFKNAVIVMLSNIS